MAIDRIKLIIALGIFFLVQILYSRYRATVIVYTTEDEHVKEIKNDSQSTDNADEMPPMDLHLLPEGQIGGMCLDGSPAGYYTNAGSDSVDSKTWVITMQGGGSCISKGSCKHRAETFKGSSTEMTSPYVPSCFKGTQIDLDCTDCSKNPSFCKVTQVRIPYCSGDAHLGNRTTADKSSWGYYFQGHSSFVQIVEKLKAEHRLDDATNIVFTGNSAGGIGVFHNIDYLQSALPNAVVKGAPNAGWFVAGSLPSDQPDDPDQPPSDFDHWSNGKSGGRGNQMVSVVSDLWEPMHHPECEAGQIERNSDPGLCYWVHNLYQYIKAPMYIIESQYDTNHLFSIEKLPKEGPYNTEWLNYVAMYGSAMRASTNQVLTLPHKNGDGLFHPSCLQHSTAGVVIGDDSRGWIPIFSDWFWRKGVHADKYVQVETCPSSFNGLPCNANVTLCHVPSDVVPIASDQPLPITDDGDDSDDENDYSDFFR